MKKLLEKFKIHTECAVFAMMACAVFMLSGCGNQTDQTKDADFLSASEYWYHYNEVTGENEKMRFNDDATFYWGCVCGEPVGDSDCYEFFDYDKASSMITLYNGYDDMSMELEVLDYSDDHILLKIGEEITDFSCCEIELNVVDSEKYLDGYSGVFFVSDANEEEIVLGPSDYDGDEAYPDNAWKTYPFADDVEMYSLFTFTKIEDGQVVENTVDYKEINMNEAFEHIEHGGYGFVWFNQNLEVSKVLFYGETVADT